jgi:hypothetical protein
MPENTELQIRHVLLGFGAAGCSQPTLSRVVSLAARLRASLQNIYVEEPDLARLAALPFTREVARYTARIRRLDANLLARRLHARAEELNVLLQQQAQLEAIESSFRTLQGELIPTILREAGDASVIIIPAQSNWRDIAGETATARISVAALYDGSEQAARALSLAATLAEKDAGDLLVLITDLRFRNEVSSSSGKQPVRFSLIDGTDEQGILNRISMIHPRLLIISADTSLGRSALHIRELTRRGIDLVMVK